MYRSWFIISVLAVGCSSVKETGDASVPIIDSAPDTATSFTVGGTVTGFAGSGMVLRLNGANDLAIAADGSFSFAAPMANGASYAVTLAVEPTCPYRVCTLGNATGTIASANITGITVTCTVPRIRIASNNWGPAAIRVTDDVLALADNATAAPRIIAGASTGVGNTELDSIAFDRKKNLVYAPAQSNSPNPSILVFASATTATGDVAPTHKILIAGANQLDGLEVDEGADRLYVSDGAGSLYIFDSASTLTGTVTPTATIAVGSPGPISLDRKADRLYVASTNMSLYVFDSARQLTSSSTPTHTVTWTTPSETATGIAIDGCRDRLYVGIRNVSAGVNVYALNTASTLTGTINLQTGSQAQLAVPDEQVMSLALDALGDLYFWQDSATAVRIVNAPHSLSGAVTVTADKTISGVVASGYGLDVMAY